MYVADSFPATRPIRVTEPTLAQEPITALEARKQVGVGEAIDYHDEDLREDIVAARRQVEHDTGVICYTGSFTWKVREFPWNGRIEIYGIRPVTAISAITYLDTNGATQTLAAANYSLRTGGLVPVIELAYGQTWPSLRGDLDGITITITAGYSTVQAIPAEIKKAVKLKLHELWKLRMGEDVDGVVAGYERLINLIRRDDYA